MLLPTNIATGLVTGQFLAGVVDGPDVNQDPDGVPVKGLVTFIASVPYLLDPTATPNPVGILNTAIVAVLDSEGYLCTPMPGTLKPSYRGVRLIATDDADLSVEGWTWNATYTFEPVNGTALRMETHSFAVPSGMEVDLITVAKVPSSAGIGTEQVEALAASAQAAAVSAAASAATAAASAQVTDGNISALVADPETATAVEVAGLVADAIAGKLDATAATATYQPLAGLDSAAAAKVGTPGTALNTAVQALADGVAVGKLSTDDAVGIYQSQASLDVATAAKVSVNGTLLNAAVKAIADTSAATAAGPKLDASQKGAASGVASLDAGSKVPVAQVPDLSASYVPWTAGHIGIEKTNPVNARVYIGSGTGTLTDVPVMGVKVKLDSPTDGTGRAPDGIQANVNLLNGATDGSVRGIVSRVDLADTVNTGAAVSLWADAWITQPSKRNAWGGNIYSSIRPGVAYTGTMVGLEVGAESYGTTETNGGGQHIVGKSTGAKMAFGLMISSDPVADGTAGAIAGAFRTHLLMRSSTAPTDNYVWIGPTAPTTNLPTGTPLFQIDAAGKVGIGTAAVSTQALTVADVLVTGTSGIRLGSTTGPRIRSGSTAPEGSLTGIKGDIFIRTGGADATPSLYVKNTATGNTGWIGY